MRSQHSSRARPGRKILALTGLLADELQHLDARELDAAEVRTLMHDLTGTASALTRILDGLRDCPLLTPPGQEPGVHHTVCSELEQAAAAAEDLRVTAESLCRLLPAEAVVPERRTLQP
ncbi:hypothetical protein FHX82_001049 [Amycolatopsis bartoniae]|uniref:Uncharacterized protein n=1 Tax=Amycolatopsis bartoniae TaxID=941986 RepID=A0A8H9J0C9_9PSEU|nr:hypothetical protein [Amycolatopsis bartoniae]MBB2934029.1 hypothetical protein [Amycolatopsis bartoniae]TVT07324.1 hypothetical protein FNH07_16400 [Amycolatopsis bartoniae]GHF85790.1 hypothetical protein GCM10017566_69580 [Amycolatopsis bartoniae]